MISTTSSRPRITFGIIVLNGEPFIRYNLRSFYPFAHEIIVVEGAYWASKNMATSEGHSTDNTLKELYQFKREEDPRGIVKIITKNGLWGGLTEQCQAWTEKATGDYIWAIDIDEFYKPEDIKRIIDLLIADPLITMMSFKLIQFCFGFAYVLHSGRDFIPHGIMECRRIFKFGKGYKYTEHEPPTVINANGVDIKTIKYLNNEKTSQMGIYIYHYTAIFRRQVENKARAYALRGWKDKSKFALQFLKNWLTLENPFHIGWQYKYHTWIEKFEDTHPPEIIRLMGELKTNKIRIEMRDNSDIEKLLSSWRYVFKSILFRCYEKLRVTIEENFLFSEPKKILVRFFEKIKSYL